MYNVEQKPKCSLKSKLTIWHFEYFTKPSSHVLLYHCRQKRSDSPLSYNLFDLACPQFWNKSLNDKREGRYYCYWSLFKLVNESEHPTVTSECASNERVKNSVRILNYSNSLGARPKPSKTNRGNLFNTCSA